MSITSNTGSARAGSWAPEPVKRVLRPLVQWIGVRYNRAEALWYDIKNKTDTTGSVPAAGLDIPDDLTTHVTGFQSVNEHYLRRVLEEVGFPDGSVFVDIGCGKGKALLIAAEYPFIRKVVGVELAESLCRVSEANIEIARARLGFDKPAEVIHGDAVAIDYSGGENIFFLNNPFDAEFMKIFIDKMEESARRQPRKIWMLYGNPAYANTIAQDGRLKLVREFKFFGPGRNITVFEL